MNSKNAGYWCQNTVIAMFDKTVKEAYLIDVAIPNISNIHSTIIEEL